MPIIKREITETYLSVSRPVALEVTRQLILQLELPLDTKVTMNGENEQPLLHNSTITLEDYNPVRFGGNYRVFVDSKEIPRKNSWFKTNYIVPEQEPVFVDKVNNIKIFPILSEQEVTLKLGFRFPSKSSARKLLAYLRHRLSELKKEYMMTATYAYPLPSTFPSYLKLIHDNIEGLALELAEPPESYEDWFKRCITPAHVFLADAGGTSKINTIEVKATGIKGGFMDDLTTSIDREDGNRSYTVMLDYKFWYSKPTACIVSYPMLVANNILPESIRGKRRDEMVVPVQNVNYTESQHNFVRLNGKAAPFNTWYGETIPSWDEWTSPTQSYGSEIRIFNCMLSVDLEDRHLVQDLTEIFDMYDIEPCIIDFMKDNASTLTIPHANPFQIALWDDYERLNCDSISIDKELVVRSIEPLDPKKRYHLTVAIDPALATLHQRMQDKLRNHGDVAEILVGAISPELNPPMSLMPGNYVSRQEWARCTNYSFRINPNASANKAALLTVMNFHLEAGSHYATN